MQRAPLLRLSALVCLVGGVALAQERAGKVQTDENKDAKEFSEYALQAAKDYKCQAGPKAERELALQDKPILRWTNPLGSNEAHGELFLWTDRGRPAAVLSLYQFVLNEKQREHHEFLSLSQEPLAFTGAVQWAPEEAGVKFTPFANSEPPLDSARQRLKQMRDLAARFSAQKTTREKEVRDLRVLPQPVYRYQGTEGEVLDGALFAVVEATDPEIVLPLEARAESGKRQWHYALARMNSLGMKAKLDDKDVWEAPLLLGKEVYNRKDGPYTAFNIR